jgi:hypothetical protein
MLAFEPGQHERLSDVCWDADIARRAIEAIVRDCETQFSDGRLWLAHPLDHEGHPPGAPYTGLFIGAAGVIYALDVLARTGFARPTARFAPILADLEERNRRELATDGWGMEAYLMGRSGSW